MLCPHIKTCEEYRTKGRYSNVQRFRCRHKEHWSKCAVFIEKSGGDLELEQERRQGAAIRR